MKTFKGYEDSDNFRQKMEEKINDKYPDLAQKIETGFMPLTACIEMLYTRAVYAFGFTGEEAGLTSEVSTRLLEIYLFFKDISKSKIIWILIHMIGLKREFMMSMTEDQLFTYLSNAEFNRDFVRILKHAWNFVYIQHSLLQSWFRPNAKYLQFAT